jgi:hypothetical protein
VEKRKDIGPSNARGRVGGGGRVKQSVSTKVEGVIRKSGKVMPEKPPRAGRVQKGRVIGVSAQKVTAVMMTVRCAISGSKAGLLQVDLDKVPARPKIASRPTGDEEEAVGRKNDCASQRGETRHQLARC